MSTVLVSIVSFAYNEEENLPVLYDRLVAVLGAMQVEWEWIVVDDRSADGTFEVIREIAARDPRVRGIRLSRNFGAHAAKTCGLHQARGDCAVSMASDLQDPPETIPALYAQWRGGAQAVWAVRTRRLGERASTIWFSRLYRWIMRHLVGLKEFPAAGASFCLLDRRVLEALRQFRETNASVLALLHWMGFRQARVPYEQQPRLHGRSGWTLAKKIRLLIDSITSFSCLPIRLMGCAGFLVAALGCLYGVRVAAVALAGGAMQGWAAVMAAVLVIGGAQMLALGILGEYLWRALAESRRRPLYLVAESVGMGQESPAGGTSGRAGGIDDCRIDD